MDKNNSLSKRRIMHPPFFILSRDHFTQSNDSAYGSKIQCKKYFFYKEIPYKTDEQLVAGFRVK